jgi:hypothetical protein
MEPLRLEGYQESMFDAYASFARSQYGVDAYQASRRYLRWLYDDNPLTQARNRPDLILCRQGEAVVGCIHKMRLRWLVKGEADEFPVLHNWIVAPEHRRGVGSLLLTGAFRGEAHAFIPSAAGDLSTIYRQLRCEEIATSLYRRVLAPLGGGLRYLITRGGKNSLFTPFRYDASGGGTRRTTADDGVVVEAEPGPELIETLASAARHAHGEETMHPEWTASSFRWRFFHPSGPQHLLLHHADEPGSFLILSAGNHRGLVAGRIIDIVCSDYERFRALLAKAQSVLRGLGAHVMLIYCADQRMNEMLGRYGLNPLSGEHPAFFFHASSRLRFETVALCGSAIDFGFEAILS